MHILLASFWRSTDVAPLIVMTVVWILVRSAGMLIPWPQADSWGGALSFALAAKFAFTAISHFHPRIRPDLIRMVPSSLPAAPLLVTATGILELLGATGLLIPSVRTVAAYCLVALLIALFPANVHAARAGLHVAGRPAASLTWRLPLQLFWAACLLWVA
jgi:uncharacterized membrane protein